MSKITIIVMIILAGAIILTLNNNGIIGNASHAVKMTNLATAKDIADLAWAEAYADGVRTVEDVGTIKGFKSIINEALAESGLGEDTINDYVVHVTTKGVSVVIGWKQEGLTIRREDQVLTIGDDLEYDETLEGTIQGLTDVKWKVLGASESGELLIMSATNVGSLKLGKENSLEECQKAWLNGTTRLDGLCEPYGKGKSATGARSIIVEDINKILGYNPEVEKYDEGKLSEYKNEVTYSYNGTINPAYTATNKLSGTLTGTHSKGFHYYNGTDFVVADLNGEEGIITTLKDDYYKPDVEILDKTSKAYTMLFKEHENKSAGYWLANSFVYTNTTFAGFGIRLVEDNNLWRYGFWDTSGSFVCYECGVRAVVSLSADIQVEDAEDGGWTY